MTVQNRGIGVRPRSVEIVMAGFLLIHGGSHGAWCWKLLIDELAHRGHRGYALDLPGHGSDPTPRASVTRQSYVRGVLDFIQENDLHDIVLVGHSLAGIILPDVHAAMGERIRGIVFLSALVLSQGESALDLVPLSRRASYHEIAKQSSDNTIMFDRQRARALFFSDLSEEAAARYYRLLTPQPFSVYLEAATRSPDFGGTNVRYILASQDKVLPVELCTSCAMKLGVEPERMDSGHDSMLSEPSKLASLLVRGPY